MFQRYRSAPSLNLRATLGLVSCIALCGCNPFYVAKASVKGASVLIRRQPIEKTIEDPAIAAEDREKLRLVRAARLYTISRGLTPGGAFTYYSKVDDEVVSWLLTAVKIRSFTPKTWWFPFVGTVPYKGYFTRKDVLQAQSKLEQDGYETNVRPVEAYSTLGWFDDPVLSLLLKHRPIEIVRTVIHETVHSTIWIPHHVALNESLAQYIAIREAPQFFRDSSQPFQSEATAQDATIFAQQYGNMAKRYEKLLRELVKLYEQGNISGVEQDTLRKAAYDRANADISKINPKLVLVPTPNNAELLDLILYLQGYALWEEIYNACQSNIPKIMQTVKLHAEKFADSELKEKAKDATAASLLIDFISGEWRRVPRCVE